MKRLAELRQLDEICDRFEAVLAAGAEPIIEDYLRELSDPLRSEVRTELERILRQPTASAEPCRPDSLATTLVQSGTSPTALIPKQLGDFRIVRELGRGGMGVVYEAEQVSLGRRVALKLLPSHLMRNERLRKRFEREAKAAGQLHHTNIVPVFGVGEIEGQPYYAMQYIVGRNLERFVGDAKTVAALGSQIASALEYAHRQGILHRDIKPSNLILDEAGTVWVTDFGLAKFDDQQQITETGDILGTIRYMPPEAFEGKATPVGDVYSLGLTLYELLAGGAAFGERDRQVLLKQVTTESPPSLAARAPHVPADLVTIITKAIDRVPGTRYPSAGEFAADLQRFLQDEPILARRLSMHEQFARWVRRNRGVAAALAVILGLLAVGALASTLVAYRFRNLANERETAREEAVAANRESQKREKIERWERYRVGISAAVNAYQFENIDAMATALRETPEELRGWEWNHLATRLDTKTGEFPDCLAWDSKNDLVAIPSDNNQVVIRRLDDPEVLKVLTCGGPLIGGRFSPDGSRLVILTEPNTVTLWDTRSWKTVATTQTETKSRNVHFNPNGREILLESETNGQCFHWRLGESNLSKTPLKIDPRLGQRRSDFTLTQFNSLATRAIGVCIDDGGKLFLHDCTNDRRLATLDGSPDCFSPDGQRMVTHDHHALYIRSSHDGAVQVTIPYPPNLFQVIWSPDGKWLLAGCRYPTNTATLWDATTGKVLTTLVGHENGIESMSFSPDGRRVLTSSNDLTARLWEVPSGRIIGVLRGHRAIVTRAFFSPDGQRIVTHALEPGLKMWDGHTGQFLNSLLGASRSLQSNFNQRGTWLLNILSDSALRGRLEYWDATRLEKTGVIRGHTSFVYDVAFHPNGEQVASASWDGTVRTWNATTGQEVAVYRPAEPTYFRSVAYSNDGQFLVSTDIKSPRGVCAVTRWDCRTQSITDCWNHQGDTEDFRACFDSTNRTILAGHPDGRPRQYRVGDKDPVVVDGHEKGEIESRYGATCADVTIRPDGRQWASAGFDGTVRFRSFDPPSVVSVVRNNSRVPIYRIVYSHDGKRLAAANYEGLVRLWDTTTFELVTEFRLGAKIYGLAFSPDGTRLACGSADTSIRILHLPTRSEVAILHGHTDYVHAVAFSPDGTRLVSCSGDKTVRVWDSLSVAERAKRRSSMSQ